jgi:hypothetical protein
MGKRLTNASDQKMVISIVNYHRVDSRRRAFLLEKSLPYQIFDVQDIDRVQDFFFLRDTAVDEKERWFIESHMIFPALGQATPGLVAGPDIFLYVKYVNVILKVLVF